MTVRLQNLSDPDRDAAHARARAAQEDVPGADANLDNLLLANTEALTNERLATLRTHARALARGGLSVGPDGQVKAQAQPAPSLRAVPARPDSDLEAARARIAERDAKPLPRHATDAQKIARAQEQAADYAIVHPHLGASTNLEASDFGLVFGGPPGGDAA